jgi:signal peptidase I
MTYFVNKLIQGLIIAGCIFFSLALATRFVGLIVNVEGQSMYPALRDGDRILMLRRAGRGRHNYWFEKFICRGQVALVRPRLPISRKDMPPNVRLLFVKRIVGVGGDTVVASVTSNAAPNRDLKLSLNATGQNVDVNGDEIRHTWHIPPKHVFVRGDNPSSIVDSLTWGPIPYQAIRGIMLIKFPRKYRATANL